MAKTASKTQLSMGHMANQIWKEGTRRGIAYVEDKEVAEKVMQIAGRRRGDSMRPTSREAVQESALSGAMAVYVDPQGRPFAWQVPFDIGLWDTVNAVVESASL